MSQGNSVALKRTFDSLKGIVDEIVYGDVIMLDEDRNIIYEYQKEYNLKIIPFKFDFIYKNGFSEILNKLSSHATNDLVLYLNCSEVVQKPERILRLINEKFTEYNTFAMRHDLEGHVWKRLYNRHEMEWKGVIHEELRAKEGFVEKLCPYFLFTFEDTEKDIDPFKGKVANDIKELTYNRQYIRLIEEPEVRTIENDWWINFAKENYDSMKQRQFEKRVRLEAFEEGDLKKYLNDIYTNPVFEKERFESNTLIEFQGSKKSL